jgi:DNA polymerase-3 subunit epsilon
MTTYIVDTETCGFSVPEHGHAIVQLAFIAIDEAGERIREFCSLIKPDVEVEPGAFAVHGISADACEGSPKIPEVWSEPDVFIAYNAKFDARHLKVQRATVVDVLSLARRYVRDVENYKLATVAAHFGIDPGKSHDALDDCLTTLAVLKEIEKLSERSLSDLISTPSQNVHLMTFGKHKGVPVAMLPPDYAKFLLSLPDLDPDLRKTLEMIHV